MVEETTTIKVSRKNWAKLNRMKQKPGESFNDAVNRCIEAKEKLDKAEQLGEVTREALEE